MLNTLQYPSHQKVEESMTEPLTLEVFSDYV